MSVSHAAQRPAIDHLAVSYFMATLTEPTALRALSKARRVSAEQRWTDETQIAVIDSIMRRYSALRAKRLAERRAP